jgi:hypothetical protein
VALGATVTVCVAVAVTVAVTVGPGTVTVSVAVTVSVTGAGKGMTQVMATASLVHSSAGASDVEAETVPTKPHDTRPTNTTDQMRARFGVTEFS